MNAKILIRRLEPVVSYLIDEHPLIVLENAAVWLDLLLPQVEQKNTTAIRWIEDLTPQLLKGFDIPFHPSSISGKYEIPVENSHVLFNESTARIQNLPIMVSIQKADDLNVFAAACKESKITTSQTIRLSCSYPLSEQERTQLSQLAKTKNIALEFVNSFPADATVFDGKLWNKYFGDIGIAPSISKELITELQKPDPDYPGKQIKDTHMIVLIPKTVKGKTLDLSYFEDLVKRPKGGGHATKYDLCVNEVILQCGQNSSNASYWALMPKQAYPESWDKTFEEQVAIVKEKNVEFPELLPQVVGDLTHYVHTGKCLFGRYSGAGNFTRCREMVNLGGQLYHTVAGGVAPSGITINRNLLESSGSAIGVSGLRKYY